jgi:predicted lysophospholipase L1 biosynthesis ABC-type transport system permease subunit
VISPELQEKYFQASPMLPLGNRTLPITGIMQMPSITSISFGAEAQPIYVPLNLLEQSGLIASGSRLTYASTIYLQQLNLLPQLEERLQASLSGSRVRFDRYDTLNGRLSEGLDGVRVFVSSVLVTFLFLAFCVLLLRSLREYLREFPRLRTAYLLGITPKTLLFEWIARQWLSFGILLV